MMDGELKQIHDQLQTNLRFFAKAALKIRTKDGAIEPLVFNSAQEYLHKRIEEQIKRIARVRILICKGRQQGCSTYVAARFYHKTTRLSGKATFILSHEADTTEKLFQMVERYHENCPDPVKPATSVANRRRLVFGALNSEYFVGTAGNENVGRGGTIQYLHASEAAYYPPGSGFSTGLLQSVPDLPGTEVIMESTANGMSNFFYTLCMKALKGETEYELVFIPWFWQTEYVKTPPEGFQMTHDEFILAETYRLSREQIYWRRMKIAELSVETDGNGLNKFRQEYPCNVNEAFQTSGTSLIKPENVIAARNRKDLKDLNAPRIGGLDPGRNKDRTVFVYRQGRTIPFYKMYSKTESAGSDSQWEMRLAGIAANLVTTYQLDKLFVDCTKGWGVVDRLHELGFNKIAVGVVFGEGALNPNVYLNKRAEMACLLAEWFTGEVSCPDDDLFHKDMTCVPDRKETSSGLTKLVDKDTIKKESGFSPDIFDATILTFAFPVKRQEMADMQQHIHNTKNKSTGLKTLRRIRGEQAPKKSTSLIFFGGQ